MRSGRTVTVLLMRFERLKKVYSFSRGFTHVSFIFRLTTQKTSIFHGALGYKGKGPWGTVRKRSHISHRNRSWEVIIDSKDPDVWLSSAKSEQKKQTSKNDMKTLQNKEMFENNKLK